MLIKRVFIATVSLLISNVLLAGGEKLPIKEALPYLLKIEPYALHVGSGNSKVFVFVDPLCPHSQDFIDLIVGSKKMQQKYRYSIFLYHLPKFDSKGVINYSYGCKDALVCLKEVMLEHHLDHTRTQEPIEVGYIQESAKSLGVDKRPYLFILKAKSGV